MGLFKRNLSAGIALGVAAGVAARELIPSLGTALRPVARTTLKSGVLAWDKLREVAANVGESLEDLTSEVQADLTTEGNGRNPSPSRESLPPKTSRKKERDESRAVS